MSIEDMLNKIQKMKMDEMVPNFLEQINFECSESMPYGDYKTLNLHIRKTELLFKTYALACARDDKNLRIETMKVFKEILASLPDVLIKYRKHVKECLKDKEKK